MVTTRLGGGPTGRGGGPAVAGRVVSGGGPAREAGDGGSNVVLGGIEGGDKLPALVTGGRGIVDDGGLGTDVGLGGVVVVRGVVVAGVGADFGKVVVGG